MRTTRIATFLLLAVLAAAGCKGSTGPADSQGANAPDSSATGAVAAGAAAAGVPEDPKTLYKVEANAAPARQGSEAMLHLAIRPVKGAVVKGETPFRARLEATGPVALRKTELEFDDRARVEGGGPVFEIPFDAKEAGQGTIEADMTFFVCVAEACMRTTEKLSVPVSVN